MHSKKNSGGIILSLAFILAVCLFGYLYWETGKPDIQQVPPAEPGVLESWSVEDSEANGAPLRENKQIYKEGVDTDIYDVYITAFPTKDQKGKILTFKDFALHTPRNHDYNPTLKCRIDIGEHGEKPGNLLFTDDTANATIRVRGNSSRGDAYKSYKVNLYDDTTPFQGQRSLNINKHTEDHMKIVTKLCTDLMRDIPDLCSYRTTFMRVWIQDASEPEENRQFVYQGLYTQTEQPNKTYLKLRGFSEHGSLYKARDFSFMERSELLNVDDPNYDEKTFESVLSIREGNDHRKLLEMIRAVNDTTTDFETVFNTYFNEDNYLTWLAFNILMGADDILNHNYLLYNPVNSQTWYFIPWDFDSNLQYDGRYQMTPSLAGGQKLNMVSLHKRYFRIEGNLQKLERKMTELIQNYLNEEKVTTLLESYKPVLEECMPHMPDVELTKYPIGDLWSHVMGIPGAIQENYNAFKTAFQYPAPMFVSVPQKTAPNQFHFSWTPSFSYQNRPVHYQVRIGTDYDMQNIVFQQGNIVDTKLDAELTLDPGIYYLDVRAVDTQGHEQVSLEHYEHYGDVFVYRDGLLQFEIQPEPGAEMSTEPTGESPASTETTEQSQESAAAESSAPVETTP